MSTVPGQPDPIVTHLSVGWEVAVISAFAIVIIAVLIVVVCQFNREKPDFRAPITNKRKRRRKKSRKAKGRDPEVAINGINLVDEEIEEVESFEDDADGERAVQAV